MKPAYRGIPAGCSPCYLTCSGYLSCIGRILTDRRGGRGAGEYARNLRSGSLSEILPEADFRCGEKIAQAPGLFTLCLDETIVSFEMAPMVESGRKHFVFLSIVFKAQCFCLEGLIEARADMVGFVVEVQGGRFFSAFRGFAD